MKQKLISLLKTIFHYGCFGISILFRIFTKVHKKRILCNSYSFTKYSCNPKYITEYLLKNHPDEYEIYWCFKSNISIPQLPDNVKTVKWRTLKYFYIVNTSEFIFSNSRLGRFSLYLLKCKGQKYIMTWHSSMGIKKIEKDAEDTLPKEYIEIARYDSSICDLILSGCQFRTNVIQKSFWYNGEILEKGTPRNDILFQPQSNIKEKIYKKYNLNPNAKLLLYAPTFRKKHNLDCYKFEWNDVISILRQKYKEEYSVLLRLHPNFPSIPPSTFAKYSNDSIVNVTDYQDMQELLCVSDILITDYSSSLFDFALLYRPCFIYATDSDIYDRGTYLNLYDLPFPIATTNEQLLQKIENFNFELYRNKLEHFNCNIIKTYEAGKACDAIYNWMRKVSK